MKRNKRLLQKSKAPKNSQELTSVKIKLKNIDLNIAFLAIFTTRCKDYKQESAERWILSSWKSLYCIVW